MQSQDAATLYFFKSWSWVEANSKPVAVGAGIAVIAILFVSYYFWRQNQNEITAGQALTQLIISVSPNSDASQLAAAYLKIAADYPGTPGGGAGADAGRGGAVRRAASTPTRRRSSKNFSTPIRAAIFPRRPRSAWRPASTPRARRIRPPGLISGSSARFLRCRTPWTPQNLRWPESTNSGARSIDAENLYQDVARNNPNSLLGSEAAFHAMQLRAKLPATPPASASPTSFNLSTKP